VATQLGQLQTGHEGLVEALHLYRALADRHGEANIQLALGQNDLRRDERSMAGEEFQAALRVYEDTGDRLGQANANHGLARVEASTDQASAVRRYERAAALYQDLGMDRAAEEASGRARALGN
jgi:tetratricopeptide (TPR) repeat protein